MTSRSRGAQRRDDGGGSGPAATWLPTLVVVVAIVVAWHVWVVVGDVPAYLVPTPGRVLQALVDSAHLLPGHVLATTTEALAGLAVGAVAGAAVAVALASSDLIRRGIEPLLVASQTVPMVVLAPLLVLWFGIGATPKIVVVALATFFPVAITTASGLAGADRDLVELVRSMGGDSRRVLRSVRVPSAVPAFFDGLRIAAAYAVAAAVIGELVAGDRGLGVFINRSRASFRVDRIFVAVLMVALVSAALFALVGALARIAAPWRGAATSP